MLLSRVYSALLKGISSVLLITVLLSLTGCLEVAEQSAIVEKADFPGQFELTKASAAVKARDLSIDHRGVMWLTTDEGKLYSLDDSYQLIEHVQDKDFLQIKALSYPDDLGIERAHSLVFLSRSCLAELDMNGEASLIQEFEPSEKPICMISNNSGDLAVIGEGWLSAPSKKIRMEIPIQSMDKCVSIWTDDYIFAVTNNNQILRICLDESSYSEIATELESEEIISLFPYETGQIAFVTDKGIHGVDDSNKIIRILDFDDGYAVDCKVYRNNNMIVLFDSGLISILPPGFGSIQKAYRVSDVPSRLAVSENGIIAVSSDTFFYRLRPSVGESDKTLTWFELIWYAAGVEHTAGDSNNAKTVELKFSSPTAPERKRVWSYITVFGLNSDFSIGSISSEAESFGLTFETSSSFIEINSTSILERTEISAEGNAFQDNEAYERFLKPRFKSSFLDDIASGVESVIEPHDSERRIVEKIVLLEDFLYFRSAKDDKSDLGIQASGGFIEAPKNPFTNDIDNISSLNSKQRAVATAETARRMGMPSRIALSMEGYFAEIYLERRGWIALNTANSIYDLEANLPPGIVERSRFNTIAYANYDYSIDLMQWKPAVKAECSLIKQRSAEQTAVLMPDSLSLIVCEPTPVQLFSTSEMIKTGVSSYFYIREIGNRIFLVEKQGFAGKEKRTPVADGDDVLIVTDKDYLMFKVRFHGNENGILLSLSRVV